MPQVELADGRVSIEEIPLPFYCPANEGSADVPPQKLKVLLVAQMALFGHSPCPQQCTTCSGCVRVSFDSLSLPIINKSLNHSEVPFPCL